MSEYFKFYLAKKNKDGVFESLGPWGKVEEKFIPIPLVIRSKGYMNGLKENLVEIREKEKVEESMRDFFVEKGLFGDKEYFTAYWLSMEDVLDLAKTKAMKEGYVLKERLDYIYKNSELDDEDTYIDYDEYVSIRRYAEMPEDERRLYAYHRWIDYDSKEYVANELATTALNYYNANTFEVLEYMPIEDLYFLVKRG